jgi:hypothetical protein
MGGFEIGFLRVQRQCSEASSVKCDLNGIVLCVRRAIVGDRSRNCAGIDRCCTSRDILLIAEYTLMRTSGMGDKERDDHGIEETEVRSQKREDRIQKSED